MTRTAMLLAVILTAACGPARAGADAPQDPAPAATAEPAASPLRLRNAPVGAGSPQALQQHKDRLRWIEGPPAIKGSRMTVLEGNPKEAGAIYTLRVSVPAGTKLAPHHHPQDERVTVLEGSVNVGFGDVADEAKGTRFAAGDFYVNPAGAHHYVWFDEPTVLQMTGIGPWDVVPVK